MERKARAIILGDRRIEITPKEYAALTVALTNYRMSMPELDRAAQSLIEKLEDVPDGE